MTEPSNLPSSVPLRQFFADHPRHWRDNLYVYPVISRRSRGLSIGVNLNPDKACNFDCTYCQVDRTIPPVVREVDLDRLGAELEAMVDLARTGRLFEDGGLHNAAGHLNPTASPPDREGILPGEQKAALVLHNVPESHRAIRDIAFSGDGEPTTCPLFAEAVKLAAEVRRSRGLDAAKLRVITDAAYLTRPKVREALAFMHANNGEIWAKLDAGTEDYYRLVNRPNVPLAVVLANILDAARSFDVVIQSLWMNIHGQPPPDVEVDAFARRLADILAGGGRIRLVQVYTVARRTAESYVAPLADDQLQAIAARVRSAVDLPIEVFGQ